MAVKASDANYENGADRVEMQAGSEWSTVRISDDTKRALGKHAEVEWTGTDWQVKVPKHQPSGGVGNGE